MADGVLTQHNISVELALVAAKAALDAAKARGYPRTGVAVANRAGQLLVLLRSDDGPGASGPGSPGPQPAVEDIDALVDQVRTSGLRVSLVRMGSPRILPPGAGLTAYRICQEALTNVLKGFSGMPQ